MINDYIGKKVRVLVSSGSGAGAISGERYSNGIMTSIINYYGVIKRVDDKFIELEEVKYTLYSLDTEKPVGFNYPISINTPVFESEKALVSISSIVAISLI